MASQFMKKNPGVRVRLEAHGSRTAARQISDLKREADVMASADSSVIRTLLVPEYADFCIDFSTNEMVLMYTGSSRFSNEINSDNWFNIIRRPGVQVGHSDPNADPCGYRTIITWKLAEKYYRIPGLYSKLQQAVPKKNIRPKETDLIALLEIFELDYVFIYRSVARQHRMKYVILPDEINLKSFELSRFYGQVSIRISGKKPGEWITRRGLPMIYGITLPKNSRNPEWGARFIAFVLGSEGRDIMSRNGQPPLVPPRVDFPDRLPPMVKSVLGIK
jgi:molybdate/tungstate transport system substrate-binding protein